MTIKRRYLPPIFLTAAAAASIVVSPSLQAEQSCPHLNATSTACQMPGNVQINDWPTAQAATQDPYLGANGHGSADAVHPFGFGGHEARGERR